ncbi:MAG TPA: hypothetical protein VM054_01600 [bacterium]|nr:hypothetical protein [bacterium]
MKRILLGVPAVLILACVTSASADGGTPTKGSFDWATNVVKDYIWNPGAHLSHFNGIVDRDGLLMMGCYWTLVFTDADGNESKCWDVYYNENVKPVDHFYKPGPEIIYDNERIRRLMAPVLQYLDDNYEEGTYCFSLYAHFPHADFPEALIFSVECWDEDGYVFSTFVDTETYEILQTETSTLR